MLLLPFYIYKEVFQVTDPNFKQVDVVGTTSELQLEKLSSKTRDIEVVSREKKQEEVSQISNANRVPMKVKLPPYFPKMLKERNKDECFDMLLSLQTSSHQSTFG